VTRDFYKRLGKKEQIKADSRDFYVHEYWPNSKRVSKPTDEVTKWGVQTEAGTMLVAYSWIDPKVNEWFIRRATSMNTTKWLDD
jgi:hypothetical protein